MCLLKLYRMTCGIHAPIKPIAPNNLVLARFGAIRLDEFISLTLKESTKIPDTVWDFRIRRQRTDAIC